MTASSSVYAPCAVRTIFPLPVREGAMDTYTVASFPINFSLSRLPLHCNFAMPRSARATRTMEKSPDTNETIMASAIFLELICKMRSPTQPPMAKKAVRPLSVNRETPSPPSGVSKSPSPPKSPSTSASPPKETSIRIICTTSSTVPITAI